MKSMNFDLPQRRAHSSAPVRKALALALAVTAGVAVSGTAMAAVPGITGVASACTAGATTVPGVRFNLEAREGRISTADGNSLYSWGFAEPGKVMQYPGPTLIVKQGDCVVVAVTNRLPVYTSIIFPGQRDVNVGTASGSNGGTQAAGAQAAKFTREVAPPRPASSGPTPLYSTLTYSFVAGAPGTYLYQSGTQVDLQPEMGLQGALVVRPNGAPKQAYAHPATQFDRENLYFITEVDPLRRQNVEEQVERARQAATSTAGLPQNWLPDGSQWGVYTPQYWMINGRTAPDTLAAAGSSTLPNQPYNALARVHAGERLLMRVINGGRDLHPMHHHGNHSLTVGRDGRMLASQPSAGPDLAQSDFTLRMVPGQTVDALWVWTGKGLGWDISGSTCDAAQPVTEINCAFGKFSPTGTVLEPGVMTSTQLWSDLYKPLPTRVPSAAELTYGEMYSGSPFLGVVGQRPVGAGAANSSGGYWHMFHSHNEREIINYGIFPGGMMTMLLIEPWYVEITE